RNVTLSLCDREKVIYSELGEMLFTHFGVSGPLVLSASSHIREMSPDRYKILIDLKPALSPEHLDARIQRDFAENLNRDFVNGIRKLFPAKLIPVIVKLSGISPEQKVNGITKEQRRRFGELVKAFPVRISGFRPVDEAIVTSGGISVKEINPKTMESKIIEGLFFAGEVIDVDAYTGGFNLQIAFSTAYSAALYM
ncbi:MAG: aminoacetone oxidase family FAD-binding enzyme, partial [Ruminococcus sp.]|nr:aminoacetone oxidase family FAD-binding enzyme [Ruminococcus sp.]